MKYHLQHQIIRQVLQDALFHMCLTQIQQRSTNMIIFVNVIKTVYKSGYLIFTDI